MYLIDDFYEERVFAGGEQVFKILSEVVCIVQLIENGVVSWSV